MKETSVENPPGRARVDSEDWLVGGGEMAKVIKALDWSRTALGPKDSWPQSLRTIVSMAQASNSPMSLAWGPGHVQIYNDGYWPICGTKHPGSMGQDFRECWAAPWPVIGEAYASAWAGKSAYLEKMRMFLDRHGFVEETWFTFSFSPITDESGRVGGVFHPVTEMTSQMLSERRTRTLRDLGSCAAKAKTSEEAFSLCADVLAEANLDLPFVLLYLIDQASGLATLIAQTGVERGTPQCPELVDTRSPGEGHWALGEVARTGVARHLDDVAGRLVGSVGPYPELPKAAWVLPIVLPGSGTPVAALIAGVSARLLMDDPYRAFYDLVTAAVAAALAGARAYEEARRKREALAEIDKAKTAFFANVSHEFRTPLTLILGPIEDALSRGPLGDEGLKTVHRNALRLLRLVNSLLDFSRIESGSLESTFEPTDLPALTAALAGSFHSLVASAGMKLVVDCAPMTKPVFVDRSHWEKIVLNLLSNAFKFTFDGEIAVRLRPVSGHVELSVSDTGTGIPAGELPKIFDRFYRIEGSRGRSFEGTGIGLALVQELVKAHGGALRAESIVGRGTTFVVSIPLGSGHLPTAQIALGIRKPSVARSMYPEVVEAGRWVQAAPPEVAGAADPLKRLRILVADDNADMREYLARLLAPHWEVELVADGRAAFDAAIARPPDLVLSDVMMPGMDGVALVRALREDARTASTPVVLLSARAGEEAVLEGIETLADDYLVKPFSARELLARVRTHLRMAEVRQRLQSQLVIADRMSAVGTLAAGVAHEINNPLAYVMSNLELIAEDVRSIAGGSPSSRMKDLEEMVTEARQGAERVRKIVRGMKTFSRADEERRTPIDVRPLLDLSINMAFNEIRHRAHIVKDFGAIPPIEADEARLGQVFVNLLVNAAHSIPEGHADTNEIRIVTSTDASGRGVIEVRDTGEGIAREILNRIFNPFFTTKAIGDGTGLGLSICHSIVKGLGGEIGVESERGVGTVFRVVLPAARLVRAEVVQAAVLEPRPSPRAGTVLVVDDDVMVGTAIRRILGEEHDVTVLSDGQKALDLLLDGKRFDVILCDLMMPQVTGMDIHAALSSDVPELTHRMVFVTGGAFTPTAQKFLDTIPNQRLEKPFSSQNLRALVRGFVHQPLRPSGHGAHTHA